MQDVYPQKQNIQDFSGFVSFSKLLAPVGMPIQGYQGGD
jgi:hypothetical protein